MSLSRLSKHNLLLNTCTFPALKENHGKAVIKVTLPLLALTRIKGKHQRTKNYDNYHRPDMHTTARKMRVRGGTTSTINP